MPIKTCSIGVRDQRETTEDREPPTILAGRLVGLRLVFWSRTLWTFTVEHVAGLRRAAVVATIPTALSIGWGMAQAPLAVRQDLFAGFPTAQT